MELVPVFEGFFFEQPSSIFIRAIPIITLLSLAFLAILEIIGYNLQYSKFWNVGFKTQSSEEKPKPHRIKISSRIGMLIIYFPAFLAGVISFWLFPDGEIRFLMVKIAVTIHFAKRVLEVLFVHKYSGGTILGSAILISFFYFMAAVCMIYLQHLTEGFPEPSVDLKYPGAIVFLVGISGNFYHHYLLTELRGKYEKGYKIPKGGLFNLVICPHYLFEILGLLGISLICQTFVSFSVAIGSAMYLVGRSYATRQWYLSKFDNFPRNVKALIPYVF